MSELNDYDPVHFEAANIVTELFMFEEYFMEILTFNQKKKRNESGVEKIAFFIKPFYDEPSPSPK